jgi:hypothetical protein
MLPLLADFVFECKFDVAATDLPRVHKQKWDLIRSKRLLPNDVIDNWLRFEVHLCAKSILKQGILHF